MCFTIATITRFAKSPSMVSGPIFSKAQLKSFRTELRTRWGAWIGTIVGLLLVLLSWPVAAQTPFPVVTGLSNPSALALDGNYIYFGENPGSTGHLSRAPKTGGPREQLLTGKALHDSGSIVGILGIDFSPTHIYFGYGGYVNTLIEEVPRGGSTTRVLANLSGSSSAGRFSGVLGSNIYYFQNFCNLQRLGTAIGATPVQVASCVWPRSTARDQNSLYFFDLHSLNVYRYDAGTVNSLVPLITGNASEGAVFLDSTNVYFAVGALVRKVAKLGGTVTNIALPAGGVMRQADDAFIYFTVGTQLWRQSSTVSGLAEIVSSGVSIFGDMVSDADYLYWSDITFGPTNATIYRLQKQSVAAICERPSIVVINNQGANGLWEAVKTFPDIVSNDAQKLITKIAISQNDLLPSIPRAIKSISPISLGNPPLWMRVTHNISPTGAAEVVPDPDDAVGGLLANIGLLPPESHTAYKIDWCKAGTAQFSLTFDPVTSIMAAIFPWVASTGNALKLWDALRKDVYLFKVATDSWLQAVSFDPNETWQLRIRDATIGNVAFYNLLRRPQFRGQRDEMVRILVLYGAQGSSEAIVSALLRGIAAGASGAINLALGVEILMLSGGQTQRITIQAQ